jgi:hypothetical protein
MRVVKSVPVEDFEFRGSIKDSDVSRLMRAFAEDPHIHETEADTLLRLNKTCPVQAPSWSGFLVDAIADYILNQSGHEGYITAEKSRWLVGKLSSDGWIANRAELDLMVAILGRARWFPLSLATFVLDQVAGAVIHGFGPLRVGQGQGSVPGSIGEGEIALIRTILNAFGGESSIPVTEPEAEVLMSINRAVGARTAPPAAWTDLYAKAIANILLSEHGYAVPPRAVALRPWTPNEPCDTLKAHVAESLGNLRSSYHRHTAEERALARLERQRIEIVTGEAVAGIDCGWLTDCLAESRRPSPVDAAVVDHLRRECLIADAWGDESASDRRVASATAA